MYACLGVLIFGLLLASLSGGSQQSLKRPEAMTMEPGFGNVPLYFVPHQGSADDDALYWARTSNGRLWLTRNSLVFDSIRRKTDEDQGSAYERDVSRLIFLDAEENSELAPCEPSEHRVNTFSGNDPSRWRTGLPTSKAVLYRGIYRNIDLKLYGLEGEIEYDWTVKPGGTPEAIRMRFSGGNDTRIDAEGNLAVGTDFGGLRHRKPVAYQVIGSRRVDVRVAFKKTGDNDYGFSVGDYNPAYDLIIDPLVLVYSTYLGGKGNDDGYDLAVDDSGAAFIVGSTFSTNFPKKLPYQNDAPDYDGFVAKFSPNGKGLVFSTYLGGASKDFGYEIALDGKGAAYIIGGTESADFPVKGALQKKYRGGRDAFVTKLSPDGQSLEFSTYLGGTKFDNGLGIDVDGAGAAYVIGYTDSANFPVKNAFQGTIRGDKDAFVAKLASNGKSLVYSTYLGGSAYECGEAIAVNGAGAAFIAGKTYSVDWPTENAFQNANHGKSDGFVAELAPSGTSLVYSTYLGGAEYDTCNAIAVDGAGAAYVTGNSTSTDFPTKVPSQSAPRGGWEAYVTKFAADGAGLVYSSFLGGSGDDVGHRVVVDGTGSAFLTGYTKSSNFPTKNAYQAVFGGGSSDAFLVRVSSSGKSRLYSTYLGGSGGETGYGLALGAGGTVFIAGSTSSINFPVKNAFQKTIRGGADAFAAKFTY